MKTPPEPIFPAPTPERIRHGERGEHPEFVEQPAPATDYATARAGVRTHRAQAPIERYLQRDFISKDQYLAATTFRNDWEVGVVGISERSLIPLCRAGKGHSASYTAVQINAATAYRRACQALGPRLSAIVEPVILGYADGGEITVAMLARRLDRGRMELMGVFRAGLDRLMDHYGL